MTLTQPPFISFIVPVYNVPTEMLCECLHSLFSLALQAHEVQIIVVDDGCDYDITQGWQVAAALLMAGLVSLSFCAARTAWAF